MPRRQPASLAELYGRGIDELIGAGHAPAAVWEYSPRQLRAYQALSGRRRRVERAELLSIIQLGTRGDAKEIKRTLRKWLAG